MAIAPLVASPPLAAREVVRMVHSVLDRVETHRVGALGGPTSSAVAGRMVADIDRAITRLQALQLTVVAEAEQAGVAAESGMTGTGAWLAAHTRTDGVAAASDTRLATALQQGLPATREALAAGAVSTEHAKVIAATSAKLPDGLTDRERAAVETALVDRAKLVDPAGLRKAARRALSAAERTQAQVDAHEDQLLRSEENQARAKTRLSMRDNLDGTTTGHFTVPTLAASILRKAVQQMASPRRFADQAAKQAKADGATTESQVAATTWEAFRAADGDWGHRYGEAFVELLEHLPTDKLSGKVAATVVVTLDHDRLKDSLGAAQLDTGHDLSAGEARRLACNAGILPAVLAGKSLPLDLGRSTRFFTEAQRVALATTYDTCAATGCDRPYAWSELHHEDPWAKGGATDLHLAVPLCGHHHRRAHDPTYHHRIDTDPSGRKTITHIRRT